MADRAKNTSVSGALRRALRLAVRRADRRLTGPRVVLSRGASRRLDAACTDEYAIPSIMLMEHASLGLAGVVREAAAGANAGVLIVCGPGNNGGDGLACSRHLANGGWKRVSVVLVAERGRMSGDAGANLMMAERAGVRLVASPADPARAIGREARRLGRPLLVVDALLGTGLSRPAAEAILEAVRACNALRLDSAGTAVLAVDLPSGIDADTGIPPGGEAIRADATATMAGIKPGLLTAPGRGWAGTVGVISIGAPPELLLRLGRADSKRGRDRAKAGMRRGGRG